MTKWIKSQKAIWEETATKGIQNAPKAPINVFSGGKT